MKNILIANSKGGAGKTTLATNLAGYFAAQGFRVGLEDLDRQKSSSYWLKRRPAELPTIESYADLDKKSSQKLDWLITDSPAGFRDDKLTDAVKKADYVIVPVQPSAFDTLATADFLAILDQEKAIRKHKTFIALVGMRVNARAHSATKLAAFMDESGLTILTYLRNAQVYATAAELGISVFDMRASLVAQELEQWSDLVAWLQNDINQEDK